MPFLDCESVESTYSSLSETLGLEQTDLEAIFDELAGSEPIVLDQTCSSEEFVMAAVRRFSSSEFSLDGAYWFHITRVSESNQAFANGILPTDQAIRTIWKFLRSLVGDEISDREWAEFQKMECDCHAASLYNRKPGNIALHGGPFAMLVRDIALHADTVGNHDYLGMPEIVEDICQCFSHRCGLDLQARYKQASRPCIVKFFSTELPQDGVSIALNYLFHAHHGKRFSLDCNTCFDGKGQPVSRQRILNIEWLA
jgi:hypothetical protein